MLSSLSVDFIVQVTFRVSPWITLNIVVVMIAKAIKMIVMLYIKITVEKNTTSQSGGITAFPLLVTHSGKRRRFGGMVQVSSLHT